MKDEVSRSADFFPRPILSKFSRPIFAPDFRVVFLNEFFSTSFSLLFTFSSA